MFSADLRMATVVTYINLELREQTLREIVPWNIQNHIFSNVGQDFHLTMYFPALDPDGIFASQGNQNRIISEWIIKLSERNKREREKFKLQEHCSAYHCMTVANSRYKLLKEESSLYI